MIVMPVQFSLSTTITTGAIYGLNTTCPQICVYHLVYSRRYFSIIAYLPVSYSLYMAKDAGTTSGFESLEK